MAARGLACSSATHRQPLLLDQLAALPWYRDNHSGVRAGVQATRPLPSRASRRGYERDDADVDAAGRTACFAAGLAQSGAGATSLPAGRPRAGRLPADSHRVPTTVIDKPLPLDNSFVRPRPTLVIEVQDRPDPGPLGQLALSLLPDSSPVSTAVVPTAPLGPWRRAGGSGVTAADRSNSRGAAVSWSRRYHRPFD